MNIPRAGALAVVFVLFAAVPAVAQDESYPPEPREDCADVGTGRNQGFQAKRTFRVRQAITYQGGEGCAEPNEHVEGVIESERFFVGETVSSEDGSFEIRGFVPAQVPAGDHSAVTVFGDGRNEIAIPIRILGAQGQAARDDGAGGGTRGGALPRTGRDIAFLVLWALVLLSVGTGLVLLARKILHGEPIPVLSRGKSRKRAEAERRALRQRIVPHLETADFRPAPDRPAAEPPGASRHRARYGRRSPSDRRSLEEIRRSLEGRLSSAPDDDERRH